MKVYYECASCFLRQAREALDLATSDESLKMDVTTDITKVLCSKFHDKAVNNVIGTEIHRLIKNRTNNNDPYQNEREICNDIAMKYLPVIKEAVKTEDDLESYIKASIIGNLLDFGALGVDMDTEALINKTMHNGLAVNHVDKLESALKNAKNVLYLADNVGEIIFDKILIKKLKDYDVNITVALKEKPILNDACVEDALKIGLGEFADLKSIGTDSIGIIYPETSEEFKEIFNNADMIIAKGLGNYEGLTELESDKPIFCLLNAKCNPVAKDIGVNMGDNVILML
ncbi:MAG: hypothetical protein CIT01_07460 [Methanobacterium sp. BRmetb2]|nr:MAG: hypothetical protein CIT01_07460 [Methanobacterium sp. BRmetb2]